MQKGAIKSHEDLEAYQMAFDAAMKIFELSKTFPKEEKYSLTDQIRRSSRAVCANLAEAWRKEAGGRGKGAGGGFSLTNIIQIVIKSFLPCPLHPAPLLLQGAAFIAKLNDSEAEAAETQTWLKFAVKCNYLEVEI